MNLLSYNWAWRSGAFDRIPLHSLDGIIKDYETNPSNSFHERVQIINIIEKEFEKSDVSDSLFLFKILKDARETAQMSSK